MTAKLEREEALQSFSWYAGQYGLPVTDLVRFGDGELVVAGDEALQRWN